jgi:hypothetical protein
MLAFCLGISWAAGLPAWARSTASRCDATVKQTGAETASLEQVGHALDSSTFPFLVAQGEDAEVVMIPFKEIDSLQREDPQPDKPLVGLLSYLLKGTDGETRRVYLNGGTNLSGETDLGKVQIPFDQILQAQVDCGP